MEDDQENRHSNNVLLFRLAISNSFKLIAETVSENEFCDILTILKSKPKVAKKLYETLLKELYNNMNEDLEDIIKEGSLQEGLKKVARLSDENSSVTEDAWRPPGDVSLHLRSLDAQKIKEESEQLEEQVTKMEEENARLMEEISAKRSKVTAINDSITQALTKSPIIIDLLEKRLESLEKCLTLLYQK